MNRIDYALCEHLYDLYDMCCDWEELPKKYVDAGDGIESETFTHPIIPERDITFSFIGDDMIECFSSIR